MTHGYTTRSWLLAVVRHRALDYWRRRAYRDDHQDALDDTSLLPGGADTWQQVVESIAGGQVLAHADSRTHDEIARLLDLPFGTVKGRLRSGLQKMRRYLHEEG